MRAFVVTVAVIVALLFIATQLFVPPLLETRVGEGLEAAVNGAAVHVSMSSFPAYRLLTGTVQRLEVNVHDVDVSGLRVADFRLQANNLNVDVGRVLQGEPLPVKSSERFIVEAVVTEDAVNEYVNRELSFPGSVHTELSSEGARLSGDVELLNNIVPVVVTGHFEPSAASELTFVVDDVEVQGAALPGFMLAVLREAYTVHIDLNEGPFPLLVDDVVHERGRIVVQGRPQVGGEVR